MQVTARSLLGGFGKEAKTAAHGLMSRGMVHFVASDAHDPKYRSPALDEARAYVAERYGERVAQVLFEENPSAALTGAPWTPMPPPHRKKKWFGLFG